MKNLTEMTIKEIKEWTLSKTSFTEEEISALAADTRAGVKKIHQQWENREAKNQAIVSDHERMLSYEKKLWNQGIFHIAGIDEVGRGPLAGPVVAAAVILPTDVEILGLTDSKKLSASKREMYFDVIKEKAIAYGIGEASSVEIDALNIYQATKLAMEKAVKNMTIPADYLLVDAMTLPLDIPQRSIIQGDAKSLSIAAASVLAKVSRDRTMKKYADMYPAYKFENNAGYGTKDHMDALDELGPTPIHRMSFTPVFQSVKK